MTHQVPRSSVAVFRQFAGNAIRWSVLGLLTFCSCSATHRKTPQATMNNAVLGATRPGAAAFSRYISDAPQYAHSENSQRSTRRQRHAKQVQAAAYSAPTSDLETATDAAVGRSSLAPIAPAPTAEWVSDSPDDRESMPGHVTNDPPTDFVTPDIEVNESTEGNSFVPFSQLPEATIVDPTHVSDLPEPMCCSEFASGWRPPGYAGIWPKDEYLCDGGDRFGTVEVQANGQMIGVDQQDTVAHVRTRQGDERVVASNCVCIYAPRFASVRHLAGLHVNDQRNRLSTVDQPEGTIENIQRDLAETTLEQTKIVENLKLQPPIAATQLDAGDQLIDRRKLLEETFDLRVLQNIDLLAAKEFQNRQKLDVASAALAAIEWTDEMSIQIMLDETMVQAEGSYVPSEQTYQYSVPPGRPCLQLIKLASCGQAQPGEEIEFLLQFRNTGTDTLEQTTIVDNLTTRLAYIPESQECSLQSTFCADDNTADSHVLRWTLAKPLKPGDGGVIHFRCKVR